MKTENAYLIYNPLVLMMTMETTGGDVSQLMTVTTGEWQWNPDRKLFPLVIRPRLEIVDPDSVLVNGDHTEELYDCRWYFGRNNEGTRIVKGTADYTEGDHGELTVTANVDSTEQVPLYFEAVYTDPRTGNNFRVNGQVELTTALSEEVNLRLEQNWANPVRINALKSLEERELTVQLYNGENAIEDSLAEYEWQVLEQESKTWRSITEEDLWYRGGLGTRTLTIDQRLIDKEHLRVKAKLKNYDGASVKTFCKIRRDYGQWSESAPMFRRGRYIRPSTSQIEVETEIQGTRGAVENPEQYFDIEHVLVDSETGNQLTTGYGTKVTVDAALVRSMGGKKPCFGVKVATRSALRPVMLDGKVLAIEGAVVVMQVPEE